MAGEASSQSELQDSRRPLEVKDISTRDGVSMDKNTSTPVGDKSPAIVETIPIIKKTSPVTTETIVEAIPRNDETNGEICRAIIETLYLQIGETTNVATPGSTVTPASTSVVAPKTPVTVPSTSIPMSSTTITPPQTEDTTLPATVTYPPTTVTNQPTTVTTPTTVTNPPTTVTTPSPTDADLSKTTTPIPATTISRLSIEAIYSPTEFPTLGLTNTSNPMWNVFLDTDCSSATEFFSLPISSKSEMRAPKPWIPNSGSTFRKVTFNCTKKTPPPKVEVPAKDVTFPFASDAYPFDQDDLAEKDLDRKIKENIRIWRESQPDFEEINAVDGTDLQDEVSSYNVVVTHDKLTEL